MSGYVRGQSLNVNGLVHIPGYGDFQMSEVDGPADPHPLGSGGAARHAKGTGKRSVTSSGDVVTRLFFIYIAIIILLFTRDVVTAASLF